MPIGRLKMSKTDATPNTRTQSSSRICHRPANKRPGQGFTLVEMLTVIVIIVLIIGLALPVFHSLNGSRSQEGATNQIAAMLSRAREAAVAAQQPRGVAFYTDSSTGQTAMVLVQPEVSTGLQAWASPLITPQPAFPKWTYVHEGGVLYVCTQDVPVNNSTDPTADSTHTYWYPADLNAIDEIPDTNAELLPIGVGAQVIVDWGLNTNAGGSPKAVPASDAYASAGAIMFDASGRLTSFPISITQQGFLGTAMGMAATGSHDYPNWYNPITNDKNWYTAVGAAPYYPFCTLYSSFGVAIYDRDAFTSHNYTSADPTFTNGVNTYGYTGGTPTEQAEEQWLDQNATPLLINRYNGTLIRGQ